MDCSSLLLGDGGQSKWEGKDLFLANYLLNKTF